MLILCSHSQEELGHIFPTFDKEVNPSVKVASKIKPSTSKND